MGSRGGTSAAASSGGARVRSAWGVRWVPLGGTSLGSWVLGGTTRQAAVLAKSSNYYGVPRGAFFWAARRRAITA